MANWMIRENDQGCWSVFRDNDEQRSDFATPEEAQKFVTRTRFAEAAGVSSSEFASEPEKPRKRKRIVLKAIGGEQYLVTTVDNSVAYTPGEVLGRDVVSTLCEHSLWQVSITT